MTKKLFAFVIFAAAIGTLALALSKVDPVPEAGAAISDGMRDVPDCPNPGLYTGTSDNGDFQEALDDAIAAAVDCAGCCDIRVSWEFVAADGQVGGIIFLNEANVDIQARW